MKCPVNIYRLISFMILSLYSCSPTHLKSLKTVQRILNVQRTAIPSNTRQLLVVFNSNNKNPEVVLLAVERVKTEWKISLGPIPAGIGENGFATPGDKTEGDGKTPGGIFKLGHLYTYDAEVKTQMPYSQTTSDDKWIDDPESDEYNQHIQGETNAKSYENLKLNSNHYKYCMVIEYNTNPVEKGKGSAIFFHLRMSPDETTAGCVAVLEPDMIKILKWMNPEFQPMILMGNNEDLLSQ